MALQNTHKYDDIIHLARPVYSHRVRMSDHDRAAQFSPFAALTGFDDCIDETARITDTLIEPEGEAAEELNRRLCQLDQSEGNPEITLTHFHYDPYKAGGSYIHSTGNFKRIDQHEEAILFTDGRAFHIPLVLKIQGECFPAE